MSWFYKFEAEAWHERESLDREAHRRIVRFLDPHFAGDASTRPFDQPRPAPLHGCGRDRMGDDRVLARILDERIFVRIVRVDHRTDVYDL